MSAPHTDASTPQLSQHQARAAISRGIEPSLESLRELCLRKRLLEMLVFVGFWPCGAALTLAGAYWLSTGWLQTLAISSGIVVSALALNAYVLMLHESMHHTLFANRLANRWIGVFLGAPLLISMTAYQVMHLRHHQYLGDPRDPDDYQNYTRARWLVWTMHFVRLFAGAFLYVALIPILACKYGAVTDRIKITQEYVVLLTLYAIIGSLVAPVPLLLIWFAPACLVALMTNVRGFTQHGIADAGDPYLASRTMRAASLVKILLLNENYHLEHHLFPDIPNYNLERLHRLIWPRLPRAVVGRSYLMFIVRFLRATMSMDQKPIGLTHPAREAAADAAPSRKH